MGRINILPPETANKIAAGEVVERPASIVKELIENSIDGNSTNIIVHVTDGGKEKIEIIDNGIGIEKEDIPLAFLRHATSKIKEDRDLENILSLGFRGEALPSIAAVAKVSVTTKAQGQNFGMKYVIEGGKQTHFDIAPSNQGTRIVIEDLFFNTPARKKFLKTTGTEVGYISDLVGRFILSYPDISFQLTHNNRILLKSPGDSNIKNCIAEVYGFEAAENCIEVNLTADEINVSGVVIKPILTKSSRNGQMFFINCRIVKSTMLSKAMETGYNTLLPIGRYPQGVLNITIAPSELDVNVHPSKQEIKFKAEKQVFSAVKNAVDNALKGISLVSEFKHSNVSKSLGLTNTPGVEKAPSVTNPFKGYKNETYNNEPYNNTKNSSEIGLKTLEILSDLGEKAYEEQPKIFKGIEQVPVPVDQGNHSSTEQQTFDLPEDEQYLHPFFLTLKVLGQYTDTYIVCVDKEQVYFIDQHAAQEKIFFERAFNQLSENPVIQQIIPTTLELSPGYKDKVLENLQLVTKLGFDIEPLDGNTVMVRGLPFFINKTVNIQVLFDSIEELMFDDQLSSIKKYKEAIIALISCKGSIKANHKLSHQEMEQLIKDLGKISNPYSCPHGRPTLISLDKYSIEKLFKRVN
ncbi:DNA mismatch repair endonuclease MutL [Alkalicella caledoniensis]|uniref:DNA mismatch repair protein MutL n=1 Tax=Alkalicella caledoniensis TaxID=2731377 RepID=A0A7G9WCV1_ALKCA|nr:DNA mismatch repair endonuclease MutL [Alkalicella caledoniensis]QNO16513.1 DNA mismatch repair endonuclease MutL [Alkalicella caledoniensis]